MNYFEIGRVDYFNQLITKEWDCKRKGILVARNEVDYLKPTHFYDELFVETYCENVGKKSLTLGYKIFSEKDSVKVLCATGRSILVCFDFGLNSSVEVFEEWKKAVED